MLEHVEDASEPLVEGASVAVGERNDPGRRAKVLALPVRGEVATAAQVELYAASAVGKLNDGATCRRASEKIGDPQRSVKRARRDARGILAALPQRVLRRLLLLLLLR